VQKIGILRKIYIPDLWAHQAFCFTNPTFEAVDSLLPEVMAIKSMV